MYLSRSALSTHAKYATPFGDLIVDRLTVDELAATGKFDTIPVDIDEAEHSLEMHCPYIQKMISLQFKDPSEYPTLVPVMVGNTSGPAEEDYGKIFSSYLADPTSVFVVSSDFCHWGTRFGYTLYIPNSPTSEILRQNGGYYLKKRDADPTDPHIHESIGTLDKLSMDAIETGSHKSFLENLAKTDNTVCGRHPIGVILAAISVLRSAGKVKDGKGYFKFIRYSRSSNPVHISDSSVSYASAYAVL
jgi:AmmeMemoRadiSam system protein B